MNSRPYVLGVLVALSTLNQLDRQLLAILLEPIRQEFTLSDVQLGLLSGLAFAAIYAALSIPAALVGRQSQPPQPDRGRCDDLGHGHDPVRRRAVLLAACC